MRCYISHGIYSVGPYRRLPMVHIINYTGLIPLFGSFAPFVGTGMESGHKLTYEFQKFAQKFWNRLALAEAGVKVAQILMPG